MIRSFAFAILVLGSLSVLVPLMPNPIAERKLSIEFDFSQPKETLDIDGIRLRTRSSTLRMASEAEVRELRVATIESLANVLRIGSERERALAAATLGASHHPEAVPPLIAAFEQERDPHLRQILALALAESNTAEAAITLVNAIRGKSLRAYEACRAMQQIYGLNLGLDADAWDRWLNATASQRN